ncbi:MAG: 50S ribosomal protein L18 [Actinomycetes bacterium]|jgi:large subunit ribosomal protein L18
MSRFTRPGKNLSKKSASRRRRHIRVRKKITGTTTKPRLVVTRSLRNVSVQVIDDLTGKTLAYASSIEEGVAGDKTAQAKIVGKKVAERATAAGIKDVVFDRAGRKYHGRVAALADGAREGGLTF